MVKTAVTAHILSPSSELEKLLSLRTCLFHFLSLSILEGVAGVLAISQFVGILGN